MAKRADTAALAPTHASSFPSLHSEWRLWQIQPAGTPTHQQKLRKSRAGDLSAGERGGPGTQIQKNEASQVPFTQPTSLTHIQFPGLVSSRVLLSFAQFIPACRAMPNPATIESS